jgi:hypothetical protein
VAAEWRRTSYSVECDPLVANTVAPALIGKRFNFLPTKRASIRPTAWKADLSTTQFSHTAPDRRTVSILDTAGMTYCALSEIYLVYVRLRNALRIVGANLAIRYQPAFDRWESTPYLTPAEIYATARRMTRDLTQLSSVTRVTSCFRQSRSR